MEQFNLEPFVDSNLDEMYALLPKVFTQTYIQDKRKSVLYFFERHGELLVNFVLSKQIRYEDIERGVSYE